MKIYYSPCFSGHVYIDFENRQNITFDSEFVNTDGLIRLIALHLGVHVEIESQNKRLVAYYDAFKEYMSSHPDNVFAASYDVDNLATVKQCLAWRDELAMYGWNADCPTPSKRLEVLSGVEKLFMGKSASESDFVNATLSGLRKNPSVLEGSSISVLFSESALPPVAKEIFRLLASGGCEVSFEDTQDVDKSLSNVNIRILDFETETEAQQYLASLPDNAFDVWINSDNQALDSYLKMSGKPTTGSMMKDASPQLLQLLSLGIRLFNEPLDIQTLMQWLNSPEHPLPGLFRSDLAKEIASKRGYRRVECKGLIEKYINGAYEYVKNKENLSEEEYNNISKGTKHRKKYAEYFLPSVEPADIDISKNIGNTVVEKKNILTFASLMKAWCEKRILRMENESSENPLKSQFAKLMEITQGLIIMLDTVNDENIEFVRLEGWLSSLYKPSDYTQYAAQQGCREMISNPAAMADKAKNVIWCDAYGADSRSLSCSFLSENEREVLSGSMQFYPKSDERELKLQQLLYPLTHTTDSLTLVTCQKRGGAVVPKHPFIIWLASKMKIDNITVHPTLNTVETSLVDNHTEEPELHLHNASLIKWPDHESHSSLELLTQYPLDYALQYLAKINDMDKSNLEDAISTKGTVAHAVIEKLFSPEEGKTKCASEIRCDFDSLYTKTFNETLQSDGAILLQPENIIATRQLYTELKRNIEILIDVIEKNDLKVRFCEKEFDGVDVGIRTTEGEIVPIRGFTDMILIDNQGNNVIFDFKWTTSNKWYGLLNDNLSTQLALYSALIKAQGEKVSKTAYFIMPEGCIYSNCHFNGEHIKQVVVAPERADIDLMQCIRNSFLYRKNQIDDGIIEFADGIILDEIPYAQETETMNLIPLKADAKSNKYGNIFSIYKHLK